METEQEKILPFLPMIPQPGAEVEEMKGELSAPETSSLRFEFLLPILFPPSSNFTSLTFRFIICRVCLCKLASAVAERAREEATILKKPPLSSYGVEETGKVVEEWDYLNRFFKRLNKVHCSATTRLPLCCRPSSFPMCRRRRKSTCPSSGYLPSKPYH